jgi:holo-[acyl-carrier protein] synthase
MNVAQVRVGTDAVAISDVAESVDGFGHRYLNHVFTPHELECCTGSKDVANASLAARFAAKEAVIKVLRPAEVRPPWSSIEVRRDASGACDVFLSGAAAKLAAEAHVESMSLSLTHEHGLAVAVVVALCGED